MAASKLKTWAGGKGDSAERDRTIAAYERAREKLLNAYLDLADKAVAKKTRDAWMDVSEKARQLEEAATELLKKVPDFSLATGDATHYRERRAFYAAKAKAA